MDRLAAGCHADTMRTSNARSTGTGLLPLAVLACVLALGATCCKPAAVEPGQPVGTRYSFDATSGPRTPEGSRLQGQVTLSVAPRPGHAARASEIEADVRAMLVEEIESRYRSDAASALGAGL